jgi:transcriptional regulator with XRE-family HTH domain
MGISFQAVQKYENGENRLAVGRLARAADLLGQPVSFFFSVEPAAAAPSANLSAQEAEFVRHFRNIEDPDIRAHLVRLVREIDQSRPRREE